MRNLTRRAVVIEHPSGHRKLVERSEQRLEYPDLHEEQETAVRVSPERHAVPVCRRRECPADERERINTELRRHVNEDRDETGDGVVLVEGDLLPLIDHDLRNSVFAPQPTASRLQSSTLVRRLIGAGELP